MKKSFIIFSSISPLLVFFTNKLPPELLVKTLTKAKILKVDKYKDESRMKNISNNFNRGDEPQTKQ